MNDPNEVQKRSDMIDLEMARIREENEDGVVNQATEDELAQQKDEVN
jgi:hypothetical protein